MLQTIPHGEYECAFPGDASREAWVPMEKESFRIIRASRYRTADGGGTYILRDNVLTFTAGPKNGQKLRRTGPNQLRLIMKDGSLGRLLCVRAG